MLSMTASEKNVRATDDVARVGWDLKVPATYDPNKRLIQSYMDLYKIDILRLGM